MTNKNQEQPVARRARLLLLVSWLATNAVVWFFCLLQIFLFEMLYSEMRFMIFFFVVFAMAFSLISLADCAFSLFDARIKGEQDAKRKSAAEA